MRLAKNKKVCYFLAARVSIFNWKDYGGVQAPRILFKNMLGQESLFIAKTLEDKIYKKNHYLNN